MKRQLKNGDMRKLGFLENNIFVVIMERVRKDLCSVVDTQWLMVVMKYKFK